MEFVVPDESAVSCGDLRCRCYFWLAATFSYYRDSRFSRKLHCSHFRRKFVIFEREIRNPAVPAFPTAQYSGFLRSHQYTE